MSKLVLKSLRIKVRFIIYFIFVLLKVISLIFKLFDQLSREHIIIRNDGLWKLLHGLRTGTDRRKINLVQSEL